MKDNWIFSKWFTTAMLTLVSLFFLAGCSQGTSSKPLYVLAGYDANGDGKIEQDIVGEEGQAIYALQPDGDEVRLGRLTDPTTYLPDMYSLSPDGKYLAFNTKPPADNAIGSYIYILDLVKGGAPVEIPYEASLVEGMYWSHIGQSAADSSKMRLAVIGNDTIGNAETLIITPQGVIERQIPSQTFLENEFQDYNPYASPDRTQRIWPKAVENGYLLSKTGFLDSYQEDAPLLSDIPLNFIEWSPDSQRILTLYRDPELLKQFDFMKEPHGALFTLQADNGELTPLTAGAGASKIAAWSPDSRDIAYLTQLEDTDNDGIADTELDAPVLYILGPDGKAQRIDLGEKYQLGWGLDW